jgi:hypothetical protein
VLAKGGRTKGRNMMKKKKSRARTAAVNGINKQSRTRIFFYVVPRTINEAAANLKLVTVNATGQWGQLQQRAGNECVLFFANIHKCVHLQLRKTARRAGNDPFFFIITLYMITTS